MEPGSIIQIVVLVILVVFSAFFSSAETALTTVNKIKMKTLAEEGNKRAERVLRVTDDSKKMLSAILIGNNIVNLSASSLATTLATRMIGSAGAGIATGILTLVILIFGEITPKTTATIRATEMSMTFSGVVWALMVILTPVIFVVNALSRGVMRLFGVNPDEADEAVTEEELRTLVDVSHENGMIEEEEREYIHNIFDFTDSTAKEIMIPRIDMSIVDVNTSYDELMEVFAEDMHTRLPVYEDEPDNIIGLINMKDMLLVDKEHFSIRDYVRKVYVTYEQKHTAELFEEMRKERLYLTIVVDEYGALAGMITLEDLLEEVVGEIRDEYDGDEEDELVQLSDCEYEVQGSMNLEDVCEELDLNFNETDEDFETIGGYLIGLLNHFPEEGEVYETEEGVVLRVDEAESNRIIKLNIYIPEKVEQEKEE